MFNESGLGAPMKATLVLLSGPLVMKLLTAYRLVLLHAVTLLYLLEMFQVKEQIFHMTSCMEKKCIHIK